MTTVLDNSRFALRRGCDLHAAILGTAALRGVIGDRLSHAEALGRQPVRGDAVSRQPARDRSRARLREFLVELAAP